MARRHLRKIKSEEEIETIQKNLEILRAAKKNCTCYDSKEHYHELLWDGDAGNDYIAESKSEHEDFINKLLLRLQRVQQKREAA